MSKNAKYKIDVREIIDAQDVGYETKINILDGCIKQEQKTRKLANYINLYSTGFTGAMTFFAIKSFVEGNVVAGLVHTAMVGVGVATSILSFKNGKHADYKECEYKGVKEYLLKSKEKEKQD